MKKGSCGICLCRSHLKNDFPEKAVMPAKAGIQNSLKTLDSRLQGNDKEKQDNKKFVFEMASSEALSLEGRGLGEGAEAISRTPSSQSHPLTNSRCLSKGGEVRRSNTYPRKTGKLSTLALLCALLLSAYSPVHGASETPDCMIDQGPCTSTVAGRQVVFEISPRPVRFMKELTFTVTIRGGKTAPTLLLDLSMPGMYMGINQVILKKTADSTYRGTGIIPRCPSGKKLWRAEVGIPGGSKASYTFNVSQ